VYDVTGPELFTARELAALYAELGGREVRDDTLDDDAFTELLAGEFGGSDDEHARYGAELVASFGRSIRDGYMASKSDVVERLTGRPPRTLRSVLEGAV
jgi:NAD(P)H dehydrogenase (quinone)